MQKLVQFATRRWPGTIPFLAALLFIEPTSQAWRTVFYVFQTRDLSRAQELAAGHLIWFGPETSGGGNLPGPAYYYLLAPVMGLFKSWEAAWWQMIVMAAAAAVMVWNYLKSRGLTTAASFFVGLFALSCKTEHFLNIFINPSYLFVFAAGALIAICRAFDRDLVAPARERALWTAGLFIGIGAQVHFSIMFFVPAVGVLLRGAGLSRRSISKAAAALVLPFVPYLIWQALKSFGVELGQPSPYVGDSANVWPTLIHLLGAIESIAWGDLAYTTFYHIFRNIPPSLIVLGLVYFVAERFGWQAQAGEPEFLDQKQVATIRGLIRPLLICMAFTFIPLSYVFVVPIANRYGMPFFISITMLAAVLQIYLLRTDRMVRAFNIATAVGLVALTVVLTMNDQSLLGRRGPAAALLAVGLILATGGLGPMSWRRPSALALSFLLAMTLTIIQRGLYRVDEKEFVKWNKLTSIQWTRIWRRVITETGWTLEEAKRRVYFINSHIDSDPAPIFNKVKRELRPAQAPTNPPDGYIVAINPALRRKGVAGYLDTAPIADDLKQALRLNEVEIRPGQLATVMVIPYRVRATNLVPRPFHNWALFYETDETSRKLFAQVAGHESVGVVNDGRVLFKWNECPDHNPYCDTGIAVRVGKPEAGEVKIQADILGEPLAQVSPWIHPTWTLAWVEPYLSVRCGKASYRVKLASSVGYLRQYLHYQPLTNYFIANNSLIAPYSREISVPCKEPVGEITAGWGTTVVETILESRDQAGRSLSYSLSATAQ